MASGYSRCDDIYVILESDRNRDFYPSNTGNNFKNYIQTPVPINSHYSVAIVDLLVPPMAQQNTGSRLMKIKSNLTTTMVENGPGSVLRAVAYDYKQPRGMAVTFTNPYYLRVCQDKVTSVSLEIEDEKGRPFQFDIGSGGVTLTLHFKKVGPQY